MQNTLRVEPSQLVEADLVCRVLPAIDAATLATMVPALEEAKRFLARRRGTDRSGTVSLNRIVSRVGLERYNMEDEGPASGIAPSVGMPNACATEGSA